MRGRSLLTALCIALPCLFTSLPATAGWRADVEIYDRNDGRVLPVYEHAGRLYVAGEPQHRYEVRIRNRSGGRVLAVTSVDGVNVISGETAAGEQRGYVIDAHGSVAIDGWRRSLDDVASFYFTSLRDSYAARTGRPRNVGVIGVALFGERQPCCRQETDRRAIPPAEAPSAAAADSAVARQSTRERSSDRLGTGHGERQDSPAQYVDFRRASSSPDETIIIYYDSRRNLVAQGVIPHHARYADRLPEPFPNGFVADP